MSTNLLVTRCADITAHGHKNAGSACGWPIDRPLSLFPAVSSTRSSGGGVHECWLARLVVQAWTVVTASKTALRAVVGPELSAFAFAKKARPSTRRFCLFTRADHQPALPPWLLFPSPPPPFLGAHGAAFYLGLEFLFRERVLFAARTYERVAASHGRWVWASADDLAWASKTWRVQLCGLRGKISLWEGGLFGRLMRSPEAIAEVPPGSVGRGADVDGADTVRGSMCYNRIVERVV